jgi:hypothetical protein
MDDALQGVMLELFSEVLSSVDSVVNDALFAIGPGHLLTVPIDTNLAQPAMVNAKT